MVSENLRQVLKRNKTSRTKNDIGVTRTKLADMLNDLGFDVQADDLNRIYGSYKFDLARWACDTVNLSNSQYPKGHKIHIYSYSTMKDCVRYGLDTVYSDGLCIEFTADYTSKQKKINPMEQDSFDYINRTYGLTVKPGDRVRQYEGFEGTVVGADGAHLLIQLDRTTYVGKYHPTWEMTYLKEETK